jgi:hypothetical protein
VENSPKSHDFGYKFGTTEIEITTSFTPEVESDWDFSAYRNPAFGGHPKKSA